MVMQNALIRDAIWRHGVNSRSSDDLSVFANILRKPPRFRG
jgi:hypothetical protein